MRTAQSKSKATVANLSLSDFNAAIRAVGPDGGSSVIVGSSNDGPGTITAAQLTPAIPKNLADHVGKCLDGALKGRHPIDPMLGQGLSEAISSINAIVKRSGGLIEHSLAEALQRAGYVVLRQVAMQISPAARDLVSNNDDKHLRHVSIISDAPAHGPTVVFDIVAFNPKTRNAYLLEVKRGNGPTELRKIRPITETLKAGGLQLRAYLATIGLKARRVDAKVIDFYGHSGFGDDIRIVGDRLDFYFGASVRPLIDLVLERVRKQTLAMVPTLLGNAIAATNDANPNPPRTIMLRNGVRIAPEYIRCIEVARRGGRPKRIAEVVTLPKSSRRSASPPVTTH